MRDNLRESVANITDSPRSDGREGDSEGHDSFNAGSVRAGISGMLLGGRKALNKERTSVSWVCRGSTSSPGLRHGQTPTGRSGRGRVWPMGRNLIHASACAIEEDFAALKALSVQGRKGMCA